jgi:C4-dicarboxylate-specific signal transduction histidine kinase
MVVLLVEMTTLYADVARSNTLLQQERLLLERAVQAQRREREARLMTGDAVAAAIAHEVKQPLSAMITNADAGLRFLSRAMPELHEAKAAFTQISADGHRAGAVIGSIRALFRKGDQSRVFLDLNDLIEETLAVVREDLAKHRILLTAELDQSLPKVSGDRIQLQQVFVNLITNAIESMANVQGSRVLSVKTKVQDDGDIRVSVGDSGAGVGSQDLDRIFNPLFTTKSGGMGMGLAICRSIMEAHEGRLWVPRTCPPAPCFTSA